MEYHRSDREPHVPTLAADRAARLRDPGQVIDCNDVVVAQRPVARATERARSGEGPTVIAAPNTGKRCTHHRTPADYRPQEIRVAQRDPALTSPRPADALGVPEGDVAAADERRCAVAAAVQAAREATREGASDSVHLRLGDGGSTWRVGNRAAVRT